MCVRCKLIMYTNTPVCTWVKDVKMPALKEIDKKWFYVHRSTLNIIKVSTFKVSNKFLENKMSKFDIVIQRNTIYVQTQTCLFWLVHIKMYKRIREHIKFYCVLKSYWQMGKSGKF